MTTHTDTFETELGYLEHIHDKALAKVPYYRCYDDCPDTALQASMDIEALILKEIKKTEPEAHCTYFPTEAMYQVHVWGRDLGGQFSGRKDALLDALAHIRIGQR